MSDFLSNLVERSVAATVAVRPQLFSIFEPPSAGGGTFFRGDTLEQDEQEPAGRFSPLQSAGTPRSVEPAARSVAPLSKADLTSPGPAGPRSASQIQPRADLFAGDQNAARTSARSDMAGATKADVGPAPKPNGPGLLAQIEAPIDRQSAAPLKERRGAADATEQGAIAFPPQFPPERRTSVPSAGQPRPGDLLKERLANAHPEKIIGMTVHEPRAQLEPAQVRSVYAVSQRPALPRFLDNLEPEKNPPPGPTINVTIGRIEVRATRPSPARPPAASAPSPIMSLDEYLRQRAGGDRR